MEKRSIDIKKQKMKEVEDIFQEPQKVRTVIKDPFNWRGASVTLGLLLLTTWSVYFATIQLRSTTPKTTPEISPVKKENTDTATATKKNETTPPALPSAKDDLSGTTRDPFAPFDSSSSTTDSQSNQSTVTPEIAKGSFKIRILNGNGVVGDAAKIKSDLVTKGFNVGSIGNANLKYDKTQVYYIAGKQKEAELVAQNLTGKQTQQKEAEQSLVGTDYQVLIVIGKL